jgi:hypothetical protein
VVDKLRQQGQRPFDVRVFDCNDVSVLRHFCLLLHVQRFDFAQALSAG